MEDNVTGEPSDLGPYCLKYKLLRTATVSNIRTSTD